jgi:peptide alpha-N-acetyltransferase
MSNDLSRNTGVGPVPGGVATLERQLEVEFSRYEDEERQIDVIMDLVDKELSEPYSIFTYRYFINNWPNLCILAHVEGKCVGVVICKLDQHRESFRGYVGMLVVDKPYRKLRLGSALVSKALEEMQAQGAEECVLEVESTNVGALGLYQNLGFIRDKRLERYYLSGNDAFRMKLLFPLPPPTCSGSHTSLVARNSRDETPVSRLYV